MPRIPLEPLFGGGSLSLVLTAHANKATDLVSAISREQFSASTDDEIVEHIVAELTIEPLIIHENESVLRTSEAKLEVPGRSKGIPGVRVIITIPYQGDPELWKLTPSRSWAVLPRANIRPPHDEEPGFIDIIIEEFGIPSPDDIKRQYEKILDLVKGNATNQADDIAVSSTRIEPIARQAIEARRRRLDNQESIIETLAIPVAPRNGMPHLKYLRIKPKRVKPLRSGKVSGGKREYAITDEVYDHILSIIRHVGRSFETAPETFSVHDEEALRNFLLAHLNGYFVGGATGETFRRRGKTDMRIEGEDRAAFIAECKVWRGPKEALEGLDQLLGYLTWRDCKCSYVIFNKHNSGFSQLLSKVPDVLNSHSRLITKASDVAPGEWRFSFACEADEGQRVTVHVFLFNLFYS